MVVESRGFFWSWSYKNHRVHIVLDEFEQNCWRVNVSLKCMDINSCACASAVPEIEGQTFSSAKEALQTAELLTYRHIDRNRD